MKLLFVFAILFVLIFIFFQIKTQTQTTEAFGMFLRKTGPLQVDLELAQTPQEIEQGLMYRTHLPPNTGMLFTFPTESHRSFWMRNTLVPLDMIFINSAGRIVNIEHEAPPKSETLRHSKEPVQYVVELPGGTAKSQGIQIGDRFQH
jgi:uncharacterized membrane protein (UPF0127 family)